MTDGKYNAAYVASLVAIVLLAPVVLFLTVAAFVHFFTGNNIFDMDFNRAMIGITISLVLGSVAMYCWNFPGGGFMWHKNAMIADRELKQEEREKAKAEADSNLREALRSEDAS